MPIPTASSALPKPKRVTLILEASPRVKKTYGADVYSQVLWMRLDGVPAAAIADAIGCSEEVVASIITLWQEQVKLREGGEWYPRYFNPRRHRNRPKPKVF